MMALPFRLLIGRLINRLKTYPLLSRLDWQLYLVRDF